MPLTLGSTALTYLLSSDATAETSDPGAALETASQYPLAQRESICRKVPDAPVIVGERAAERSYEEVTEELLGEPGTDTPAAVAVAEPEFTTATINRESLERPGIEAPFQ